MPFLACRGDGWWSRWRASTIFTGPTSAVSNIFLEFGLWLQRCNEKIIGKVKSNATAASVGQVTGARTKSSLGNFRARGKFHQIFTTIKLNHDVTGPFSSTILRHSQTKEVFVKVGAVGPILATMEGRLCGTSPGQRNNLSTGKRRSDNG